MNFDVNGKHFIEVASLVNVIATVCGWLPSIAALLSIIWTIVSTYIAIQRWKREKKGE